MLNGLVYRDPFTDFDRLFRPLFEEPLVQNLDYCVRDRGDHITIEADLPGVETENLDLQITGATVSISAERKGERAARFARSLRLATKINADDAEAELKNGVLTIKLPKASETQPRRISVKS